MGKKSKRRAGRKSTKKSADEESNVLKTDESDDDLSDFEIDQAFLDFMLWSLSDEDKADITPKKFIKMNPHMTKKLVTGDITVDSILEKRQDFLFKIEARIQNIEFGEGIDHLITGIKFNNDAYQYAFREQLELSVSRNKETYSDSPLLHYVYGTFHEVIQRWQLLDRPICLEDSLYWNKKSKVKFDKLFQDTVKDLVSSTFDSVSEKSKIAIFEKYYLHPTAREEGYQEGFIYAQVILKAALVLFEEKHRCWRCERLHLEGEGTQTKALICAGCKCAVYCSRECQVKHWKEGRHGKHCKNINGVWSEFECRKNRVGRAVKMKKIFTKPIIVDGIKKECFLRPCEPLDYFSVGYGTKVLENAVFASMDIYYENMAKLACGGKHVLFEEETISSELEDRIRGGGYEDVLSEFDPESLKKDEVMNMHLLTEMLQYKESHLPKENVKDRVKGLSGDRLSVDRFVTLYICYSPFNLGESIGGTMNKFLIETNTLQELKKYHEKD